MPYKEPERSSPFSVIVMCEGGCKDAFGQPTKIMIDWVVAYQLFDHKGDRRLNTLVPILCPECRKWWGIHNHQIEKTLSDVLAEEKGDE